MIFLHVLQKAGCATPNPLLFCRCSTLFGSLVFFLKAQTPHQHSFLFLQQATAFQIWSQLVVILGSLYVVIMCSYHCPRLSDKKERQCVSSTSLFFESHLCKHLHAFVCLELDICTSWKATDIANDGISSSGKDYKYGTAVETVGRLSELYFDFL